MLKKRALAVFCFLAAVPISAWAAGDPTIIIDAGGDPFHLSTDLNNVTPDGTGTLAFDFLNDTGGVVRSLTFQTMVNTGLTDIPSKFSCVDHIGYFDRCLVSYSSFTGDLRFDFAATQALDGDEAPGPSFDPLGEAGEGEGMPADALFHITLSGWVFNATAGDELLYGDGVSQGAAGLGPQFSNSFVTVAEPPGVLMLGVDLLTLMGIGVLFRRRIAKF